MATTAALTKNFSHGEPVTWEQPGRWGGILVPAVFDYYAPKLAAIILVGERGTVKKFVPVNQLKPGHRRFFMK